MFLKILMQRNRPFIETAINLHQAGEIPANSYVLDLDTMQANARLMADEANRLDLVAVDLACARPIHQAGYRVGHIGHLVQISQAEALAAAQKSILPPKPEDARKRGRSP